MKQLLSFLVFCLAAVPTTVPAQTTVDWSDLIEPGSQDFEDPFLDLDDAQIDMLRTIVGARDNLTQGLVPDDSIPEIKARLEAAETTLEQAGIDANWLISQRWVIADKRKAAAMVGNSALDAQSVMIAGFAIPAPTTDDGVPTAYLVETAGMCSHTPPPLPNQMIRVHLGDDWAPAYMHQPVRVTGSLHIDPSEQVFRIVDGDVAMKATWRLDVQDVEAFVPKPNSTGGNSDWADQLRSKLAPTPTTKSE